MSDEVVLRDRSGRNLGKIKKRSDGKLEGRDHTGRLKGIYDPKRDETRDARGTRVGDGNLLSSLITNSLI